MRELNADLVADELRAQRIRAADRARPPTNSRPPSRASPSDDPTTPHRTVLRSVPKGDSPFNVSWRGRFCGRADWRSRPRRSRRPWRAPSPTRAGSCSGCGGARWVRRSRIRPVAARRPRCSRCCARTRPHHAAAIATELAAVGLGTPPPPEAVGGPRLRRRAARARRARRCDRRRGRCSRRTCVEIYRTGAARAAGRQDRDDRRDDPRLALPASAHPASGKWTEPLASL